jgi:hypothetical protein
LNVMHTIETVIWGAIAHCAYKPAQPLQRRGGCSRPDENPGGTGAKHWRGGPVSAEAKQQTQREAMKKIRKGAEWLVIFQYGTGGYEKRDIWSQHRTQEAAQRSMRQSGFESFLRLCNRWDYERA